MTREERAIQILEQRACCMECVVPNCTCAECDESFELAIKALEHESVIDKIRAEIEQITSRYSISRERGGMGQVEWSDYLIKESEVLKILDKYKAESEGYETIYSNTRN